jgi:ADP-ribosyl-[dinitrogen reductase] hydrolase
MSLWLRLGRSELSGQRFANAGGTRRDPVLERRDQLREVAGLQSRTTHAASEAVDACVVFADMLADAVEGKQRSSVLRPRNSPYAGKIREIASGSWRGKRRVRIASSGYVAHSLETALRCVASTADFETAVLKAANLGDDADTTGAIIGQTGASSLLDRIGPSLR